MKRNYTGNLLISLLVMVLLFSCKQEASSVAHDHDSETTYTCPMHPQIIKNEPGTCPICGMDLVPVSKSHGMAVDSSLLPLLKPVNEQVIASMPTIEVESGTRIFSIPVQGTITYDTRKQETVASRVAGRIERMYVKYNFQPVSKGQLVMEIYSPDLAAAQRELIYLSKLGNEKPMLDRAKQRLSLLGMQAAQIAQVLRTGKPLYRVPVYSPASGYIVEKNLNVNSSSNPVAIASSTGGGMSGMGGSSSSSSTSSVTQQPQVSQSPVLIREGQYVGNGESIFTIYQANNMVAEFSLDPSLASEVKRGQKVVYHTMADPKNVQAGVIGLVEPTQRNGQNFTIARMYLNNTNLQPGQLITANIPVVKIGASWLPENAVLQLGQQSVLFKKEGGVFIPTKIKTGIRINGLVQVFDRIAGWQIAKNANFLVDSESFIRLQTNNEP